MKKLMVLTALLALAACQDSAPGEKTWDGKWNGPEGTYLEVVQESGHYKITVANLDGPRTFEGRIGNGGLQFERDGVTETIKQGSGIDTGMKWLTEKKDCLVVKSGEGYCRD